VNSDFPAETGPVQVDFFFITGSTFETFHEKNSFEVLGVDLLHFTRILLLKVKDVFIREKIPGCSFYYIPVEIMDHHQVVHFQVTFLGLFPKKRFVKIPGCLNICNSDIILQQKKICPGALIPAFQ
jgi:hypothetical protein